MHNDAFTELQIKFLPKQEFDSQTFKEGFQNNLKRDPGTVKTLMLQFQIVGHREPDANSIKITFETISSFRTILTLYCTSLGKSL